MALSGKGFFTWKLTNCEGGDPQRIARRAADAGLSHVLIKIADATSAFGDPGLNRAVTDALHARGIQVWGWQYIYGSDPANEARVAVNQVRALGLDGFSIDAESEYKRAGKEAAARTFMSELRAGLPDTPVALSSFRYPTYHPTLPWSAFLEKCDYNMPQVYWEQAHNPEIQLPRSVTELLTLNPPRPVFPTGSAYGAGGWEATPDDLRRFLQSAKDLDLAGANFYSWDWAGAPNKTAMWNVVANFDWPPSPPPAPSPQPIDAGTQLGSDDIVYALFDALNSHNVEQIVALYQPNAAHVTAQRTIVGADALRQWYTDLLNNQLQGGAFTLTNAEGNGAHRRFTWAADSYSGHVEDGDDTLGVREGLIQYQYTSFTVER
ncbi:MAG: nuclear transport factor 2 family protein [Chloroflexi bacterium]|nr:nuclear transport factor 2 family protein [Chloroflexota bacterium]